MRPDRGKEPCSLGRAQVIVETPKAICVKLYDHPTAVKEKGKMVKGQPNEAWIPKSVVHEDSEVWSEKEGEDEGELFVFQWFAEKEQYV